MIRRFRIVKSVSWIPVQLYLSTKPHAEPVRGTAAYGTRKTPSLASAGRVLGVDIFAIIVLPGWEYSAAPLGICAGDPNRQCWNAESRTVNGRRLFIVMSLIPTTLALARWPATKPFEMFIVNPERTNAHDRTLNPNKIIQGQLGIRLLWKIANNRIFQPSSVIQDLSRCQTIWS